MIEYPTEYVFKAMGLLGISARIRELVEGIVGPLSDDAFAERPSSKGRYVSVSVSVRLLDEEQRKRVYQAFHSEKAIVWYV